MMKRWYMGKRWGCFMAAAAAAFALTQAPAFAAGVTGEPVQLRETQNLKTENFNGYSPADTAALPDGFENVNYCNRIIYKAADGMYGKSAGDISFEIEPYYNTDASPASQWHQVRYPTNQVLGTDSFFHLSTEMAVSWTNARRWLGLAVKSAAGSKEITGIVDIQRSNGDGSMLLYTGTEVCEQDVSMDKWFRLDLVLEKETGLCDLYLNGGLLREGYDLGVTQITEISLVHFGVNQTVIYNQTAFGESHTYLDNLVCETLSGYPEIEPFLPYDDITFESYTGGNPAGWTTISDSDIHTFTAERGALGKPASDTALKDTTAVTKPNGAQQYLQKRVQVHKSMMNSNCKYLTLSAELAVSGRGMNRWLNASFFNYKDEIADAKPDDTMLLSIRPNGAGILELYCGTQACGAVPEKEWLKLDMVVDMKGQTADLYLDGRPIREKMALNLAKFSDGQWIYGFEQLQFGFWHVWDQTEQRFPVTETWLDNISCGAYTHYPVIASGGGAENAEELTVTYYQNGVETNHPYEADSVRAEIKNKPGAVPILASFENDQLAESKIGSAGSSVLTLEHLSRGQEVRLFYFSDLDTVRPVEPPSAIRSREDTAPTAKQIEVAGMFQDGCVLQRDRPVQIWGWSNDENGATVTASIGGVSASGMVQDGAWSVTLPAMPANTREQTLTVYGDGAAQKFDHILIGDVYFVSGQSNAELAMAATDTYLADREAYSPDDHIRIFYQNRNLAMNSETSVLTQPQRNPVSDTFIWQNASYSSIGKFSALGYYFAKTVSDATGHAIPIGLVQTAFGGASLHELSPQSINDRFGYTVDESRVKYNAYNLLTAPAERYTARGMLWYQGENDCTVSNAGFMDDYAERFQAYVEYFRDIQGSDFPVFYVQLSSHSDLSTDYTNSWNLPRMRNIQNKIQDQIEDCYMTVSMDCGIRTKDNDIAHPRYKKPVAQRMADTALQRIYLGGSVQETLSPAVERIEYTADGAVITFKNVGGGLTPTDGAELKGFELISGGAASAATAEITGTNTVTVSGAANPTGVRYGFYQAASKLVANLAGGSGLPCPTFADQSEDIPAISLGQCEAQK